MSAGEWIIGKLVEGVKLSNESSEFKKEEENSFGMDDISRNVGKVIKFQYYAMVESCVRSFIQGFFHQPQFATQIRHA